MAKISFASPVDEIRGTLNGLVYSSNLAGSYIRRRQNSRTTKTPNRQAAQLNLSDLATQWADITQEQRDDWDTWAAAAPQEHTDSLGNAYYLSGFQSFIEVNLWRRYVDDTLQAAAPTLSKPTTAGIAAFAAHEYQGDPYVQCYGATTTIGSNEIILAVSVRISSKALYSTSNYKFFQTDQVVVGGTTYFTIDPDDYAEYWGTAHTSHRIYFRGYVQTSEGYRSLPKEDYKDYDA